MNTFHPSHRRIKFNLIIAFHLFCKEYSKQHRISSHLFTKWKYSTVCVKDGVHDQDGGDYYFGGKKMQGEAVIIRTGTNAWS